MAAMAVTVSSGKRMATPDLHELWVDSGRPGAHKFREILKRRGMAAPSEAYIRDHFLRYMASKQLFAAPPRYTGKIWSPGLDKRWQTDIIVNTQAPSELKGTMWSYALVVVDVFSRYVWAKLITSPMVATAGLREILDEAGKNPDVLSTDADPGFLSAPFRDLLASKGIHQSSRVGRNDLAVVDRVIYTLKRVLATHSLESGHNDWAERLEAVVKAYNDSPHGTLNDGAPGDIRGPGGAVKNKILYFNREEQEAANMQTNSQQILERGRRLGHDGAFRVFKHKEKLGRRVFEPSWSRETRTVGTIRGAFVRDLDGNEFPTKEVLPVPPDSTELPDAPMRLNPKSRGMLQRYADRLKAFLTAKEDRRTAASKAHAVLSEEGNIKQAVQLAGLSTGKVIANFVGAFPDVFKMETPKKGGAAWVALA